MAKRRTGFQEPIDIEAGHRSEIADTRAWVLQCPADHTWGAGLTLEREVDVLRMWKSGDDWDCRLRRRIRG